MRHRWSILLVALVGLVMLNPQPSYAQNPPPGQVLFDEAFHQYSAGDFPKALQLLTAAAAEARDPSLLGRIHAYRGVTLYVMNKKAKAIKEFEKALSLDPLVTLAESEVGAAIAEAFAKTRQGLKGELRVASTDETRGKVIVWIQGQNKGQAPIALKWPVGEVQVRLETEDRLWACTTRAVVRVRAMVEATCVLERATGLVSVRTTPPGAVVFLGETSLGTTPIAGASAPTGKTELIVRLAGHEEQRLTVEVHPDSPVDKELELTPVPGSMASDVPLSAPSNAPSATGSMGGVSPRVGSAQRPSMASAAGPSEKPQRIWTWVVGGMAAAAGVAALGVGLSIRTDESEWNSLAVGDEARFDELEAAMNRKALATNILLGAAGGLAITSVVLFFLEPHARKERIHAMKIEPLLGSSPGLMMTTIF